MASGIKFSVYFALVYQFTVSALPASKNFTTVKILAHSSRLHDAGQGQAAQRTETGVKANLRSAFLGNQADVFRLHRPGFEHVPGSVSLESALLPGLYLRYKNYKFHLEKMKPSGVFEKDATFVERKTQTKGAIAYELFNHPGWFMCHNTNSPFGLVAQEAEIGSHEFLIGCLYMEIPQKPAKQDLQERRKLDTVKKSQERAPIGAVRNNTGIITNDNSTANPDEKHNGKAQSTKFSHFTDEQSSRTLQNHDEASMNETKHQQHFTDEQSSHTFQNHDEASMNETKHQQHFTDEQSFPNLQEHDDASVNETKHQPQLKITVNGTKTRATPSNSSISGTGFVSNTMDDEPLNKTSGSSVTKQLNHTKVAQINNLTNVAGKFHDPQIEQPANTTQDLQKPKINLQHKLNMLAEHEGKQLWRNDRKKVQDLASIFLGNQSRPQSGGMGEQFPSIPLRPIKLQKNASGMRNIEGTSHDTFMNLKQPLHGQLGVAQFAKGPSANGRMLSQNTPNTGNADRVQQAHNGAVSGFTPGKNFKNPVKQMAMHVSFPNEKPGSNDGTTFSFQQNATFPRWQGPRTFQNNIAQITTKALGFLHNALGSHHLQDRHQFTKQRPLAPLEQLQRQQPQFRTPMSYLPQQVRPPHLFRAPGNKFASGPYASNVPLNSNGLAAKRPQLVNALKQYKGNSYNLQYPVNSWKGMMSVGKQNLLGNSPALPKQEFNQTAEDKDKCISLKFLNKIRKPIKLVSSMKPEGYLITAETFKLKTIFKHPRKHHHVIFYARDANDRDNEVLLNNNNAIAVTPGGCDLPFRSVLLSHHGQIANKEVERFREEDEYNASVDAARKSFGGEEKQNFNQWTSFSSCSATCGRSLQTRTRSCKPGRFCRGKTVEIRTCIQTPCPVTTCVKTYRGRCCALPFVYRGAVFNRCLSDPLTHHTWCATTPNYDKEKRWGYCQPSGPRAEKMAAVIRSFLPVPSSQYQPFKARCPEGCDRICRAWCPRTCCTANFNV